MIDFGDDFGEVWGDMAGSSYIVQYKSVITNKNVPWINYECRLYVWKRGIGIYLFF